MGVGPLCRDLPEAQGLARLGEDEGDASAVGRPQLLDLRPRSFELGSRIAGEQVAAPSPDKTPVPVPLEREEC